MALTLCGETAGFLDTYKGGVAINVKYRGSPELSEGTLAALKKLDGAVRERVVRFAEDAVQSNWWSTMQGRAQELGLGDLWSEGRSGGWLVFRMRVSDLEDRIYQAERSCVHCALPYSAHVEAACPFDATTFQPGLAMLELWEAFKQFSVEARESLELIGKELGAEIEFQLENLDDDGTTSLLSGGSETNPQVFGESEEDRDDSDGGRAR